jgi:hypothetical protein
MIKNQIKPKKINLLRLKYASLDVPAKTNNLPAYIRYIYQVISIVYLVSSIVKKFLQHLP